MEENIYQILQDWHKLLKSGVITEEEFNAKKNELLGNIKKPNEQDNHNLINKSVEETNVEYYPPYEEIFPKLKWYKQIKYWIGIFVLALITITSWIALSSKGELRQDRIISDLSNYLLKEYEDGKTENGPFYEDRNYIDSFYIKNTVGESGETILEFYPKYSGYSKAWKQENEYKLERCIDYYIFQFDTTKLNDNNRYTESKIIEADLNDDGKTDYIIDGYHSNCSGGSGSEGKYFLTYINDGKTLKFKNSLITLPLEYNINGNKLTVSGKYKSWYKESIYYFDKITNEWIYNENESTSYFYENNN